MIKDLFPTYTKLDYTDKHINIISKFLKTKDINLLEYKHWLDQKDLGLEFGRYECQVSDGIETIWISIFVDYDGTVGQWSEIKKLFKESYYLNIGTKKFKIWTV